MNISKFNKSLLWVVMLSAVSQSYSVSRTSRLIKRHPLKSVAVAFASGAGASQATSAVVGKLSAKDATTQAQEFAQEAAASVTVAPNELGVASEQELTKFESFKKFADDNATYIEFMKQGFYGIVTVGSTVYLMHKTGVLVAVKKHWQNVLCGMILPVGAGAALAAAYPETAVATVKAVGNAVKSPYAALVAGTAAAGAFAGSKINRPKTGAAVGLATAGIVGGAHKFGYTWAKDNLTWAGNKAYEVAAWTAKKACDYPKTAIGAGVVAATGALTYPLWKGYMPWNKKSAQPKKRNQVPAGNNAPQVKKQNNNQVPAGNNRPQQVQAPQGFAEGVRKAVGLSPFDNAKQQLFVILDRVAKNIALVGNDAVALENLVAFFAKHGLYLNSQVTRIKTLINDYNLYVKVPLRRKSSARSINIIIGNIKKDLA